MKIAMHSVILTALAVYSMAGLATAQTGGVLPTAEDIVTKMVQQDALRKAKLNGYTAVRHYIAVNKQHRAEMFVGVTCASDGEKRFTILSEEGSSVIRKHVFDRALREEAEASRRNTNDSTRIMPANYTFQVIGKDLVSGRSAYVLRVTPKDTSKYLVDGKIWVDAIDYSIVRIEGTPARNPSFWSHDIHFVHTYQKIGPFWLAASTHSESEIRMFGLANLTIENSNYILNPPDDHAAKAYFPARLEK